jgi:hypothetical protein
LEGTRINTQSPYFSAKIQVSLAFYTFTSGDVEVVGVAVVAGFAVAFDVLPKWAAFQISHIYCSKGTKWFLRI